MSAVPSPAERLELDEDLLATLQRTQTALVARLENPEALLTRGNLAALGWTRVNIDRIFRRVPRVVQFEDSRIPMIFVRDYLAVVESMTYGRDQVRPC